MTGFFISLKLELVTNNLWLQFLSWIFSYFRTMKLFRIFNTFVGRCGKPYLDKAGQLAVCAWVCGHVEIEAGIESREILPALCDGAG